MSEQTLFAQQSLPIRSREYWRLAAKNFSDIRMLVFAACGGQNAENSASRRTFAGI